MRHVVSGTLAGIALTVMAQPGAVFAAEAPSDDVVMTDQGDLTVHAFHHASMMLTWNGIHILVDPAPPFGAPAAGDIAAEYTAAAAPDIILVTHDHGDHFNVPILRAVAADGTMLVAPQAVVAKMPADLKTRTEVMANGDTMTAKGISIEAVPAYNTTAGRTQYHPKGRGNGYVLTLGDQRIYIAGDTEETPAMKGLKAIDVAFLPMNLPYTMDVDHAAAAVKDFRPKIVYPYHYSGSDVNAFKTMVGNARRCAAAEVVLRRLRRAGGAYRGKVVSPIRCLSTALAHWRPSRIAHTTRL